MDGEKCKRCNELMNEVVQQGAVLEWIDDILNGEEVSDFALSFPIVSRVHSMVKTLEGR